MKLYCDNLHDFISGKLRHYAVKGDYNKGEVVTLHNNDIQHPFEIVYVHYKGDKNKVLNLQSAYYYWYSAKRKPKADKVVGGRYGFKIKPDYETIERYDLRFISHETFDKYF